MFNSIMEDARQSTTLSDQYLFSLPNWVYADMQCPFIKSEQIAVSNLKGGTLAPNLRGTVIFQNVPGGVEVRTQVFGLPDYKPAINGSSPVGPHGFHIHERGVCDPINSGEPFKSAGEHWNPNSQPHGNHSGDFPVLFSNHGYARMSFFTDRFKISDIIGKAVIIHESPDDYRSQPAGNSGRRLACGVIKAISARVPYMYQYINYN